MKALFAIKKSCQFRFCLENDGNTGYWFSISQKSKLRVNTTLISVTVKASGVKIMNTNFFFQNLTSQVFSVA